MTHVGRESKLGVSLDGVPAEILELISPDLVVQSDTSPFVASEIDDGALAGSTDDLQGLTQLRTAIAAPGSKYVACQALGLNTDQCRLVASDFSFYNCDVLIPIYEVLVANDRELTKVGRQPGRGRSG